MTPKIDVPDSDQSESGTSVCRSRGLRFRGCESTPHTAVPDTPCPTFLPEDKSGFLVPFTPDGSDMMAVIQPALVKLNDGDIIVRNSLSP